MGSRLRKERAGEMSIEGFTYVKSGNKIIVSQNITGKKEAELLTAPLDSNGFGNKYLSQKEKGKANGHNHGKHPSDHRLVSFCLSIPVFPLRTGINLRRRLTSN